MHAYCAHNNNNYYDNTIGTSSKVNQYLQTAIGCIAYTIQALIVLFIGSVHINACDPFVWLGSRQLTEYIAKKLCQIIWGNVCVGINTRQFIFLVLSITKFVQILIFVVELLEPSSFIIFFLGLFDFQQRNLWDFESTIQVIHRHDQHHNYSLLRETGIEKKKKK